MNNNNQSFKVIISHSITHPKIVFWTSKTGNQQQPSCLLKNMSDEDGRFVLQHVVSDGITGLEYLEKDEKPFLCSTSWDGSFRLHDTSSRSAVLTHAMESGPLLSLACPPKLGSIATGGLDGSGKVQHQSCIICKLFVSTSNLRMSTATSVRMLDLQSSLSRLIGKHGAGTNDSKQACSCLSSLGDGDPSLLASASWSRELSLWDTRAHQQQACVSRLDLPGKPLPRIQ